MVRYPTPPLALSINVARTIDVSPPWHAHALLRPDMAADPWEWPAVPSPLPGESCPCRTALVHTPTINAKSTALPPVMTRSTLGPEPIPAPTQPQTNP